MKPRLLLLVACVALVGGAVAWRFASGSRLSPPAGPALATGPSAPAVPAAATKPGLNTATDQVAVFQRAFWRKPDATVRILHAERREWADEKTSVQKWQWFIALETQAGFRRWLIEENPFGVVRADETSATTDVTDAPAWFPAASQLQSLTTYRVPGAGFRVFIEPTTGRLFATDAGAGFTTAAR